VKEGQIIAFTGNSRGYPAHLHVDGKDKNGKSIDPEAKNYGNLTNAEFFGDDNRTKMGSNGISTLLNNINSGIETLKDIGNDIRNYVYQAIMQPSTVSLVVNTNGSNLNIRSDASTSSEVIGTATKGSTLTYTGNSKAGWLEVNTSGGKKGWVNSKYVNIKKK
jgi:hypothetical protein